MVQTNEGVRLIDLGLQVFIRYFDTSCSGQNLVAPSDTCQAAPRVPQAGNKLDISVDSHSTPRRESRGSPRTYIQPRRRVSGLIPSSHSTLRRGPQAPSIPRHPQLSDLSPPPLDTAKQQDFPDRGGYHEISRSKYSPISVRQF